MLARAPVQRGMARAMTEVAIGYKGSPLNGASLPGGPKAGQRLAPVAGQIPPGAAEQPRFVLYAAESEAVRALAARFALLVEADIRPRLRPGGIWLLRPDGYVGCAAKTTEEIAAYLQRLLP